MHIQRFDINDIIKNTAATFEGICTSRQIRLELLLSGHELYFTVFVMCFQIICDFFCDFKFFILVTVCNNIKPVHSFFLTQPF